MALEDIFLVSLVSKLGIFVFNFSPFASNLSYFLPVWIVSSKLLNTDPIGIWIHNTSSISIDV